MFGMARLLDLPTLDSYETLNRAAIEARDLLMHFRFNDKGTREKIGYWFAGAKDNAWKADHAKVEEFLTKRGALGIRLGVNWSKVSVLSHPTRYAADNSTVVIVHRITGRLNGLSIEQKRADYVVGISDSSWLQHMICRAGYPSGSIMKTCRASNRSAGTPN